MLRSRSFLLAPIMFALAAALPMHMSDVTSAAAPSDDPNVGASDAGTSPESGTTSSATTAPESADTGTTGEAQGESGNVQSESASTDTSSTSQVTDVTPTAGDAGNVVAGAAASTGATASAAASSGDAPTVAVDVEDHAEARERFAGILAKLHSLEDAVIDEIRNELHTLGSLLHLHTAASGQATATGDYKPEDLS
ncbi:hypothetical protein SAMN05445504_2385 [Burkholderia sp. CF099]|nr:hypothetical protein SAMN05445504_2385 [Burkholderia sp. CF099]